MENENRLDTMLRGRVSRAIDELQKEGSLRNRLTIQTVDCNSEQDEHKHLACCTISLLKEGDKDAFPPTLLRVGLLDELQSVKEIKEQLLSLLPQEALT